MKKIIITTENAGKRIDKFLSEEFFSLSRGEIIRRIKKGKVLVKGNVVKPSYELKESDDVKISFEIEPGILLANAEISIKIIFEDENIIVIDKPAGIQMHPSATEKEKTVANWLIARYPQIKDVHDGSTEGHLRPGIVHRLDKETSGIVVIAKNMNSLVELKSLFAQRKIIKKYIALVWGNFQERSGVIEKPIARATDFKKQKIAVGRIKGKAREAVTNFKILKSFEGFDLVEAQPKTGRMHQIRIHFFSVNHPVVGDKKYVLKKYGSLSAESAKRHLLHAKSIEFELFEKKYVFSSEIPGDFSEFLANLGGVD